MRKHEFYEVIPRDRVRRLVGETRLPAFLYFTEIVARKVEALAACLPSGFGVHYAFKANPHPGILGFLRSLGVGADVASGGELRSALATGFPPPAIEFTGPGKTREELALAVDCGVGAVNAESLGEIRVAAEIARGAGKHLNLGLRVNPRLKPVASAMRMGGDTQFGIIEDELGAAFELVANSDGALRFVGYHFHLGSQFMRAEELVASYEAITEAVGRIAALHGAHPEKVNFGGGWGVDMFARKEPLDLEVVKEGLARLFPCGCGEGTGAPRCVVEPGRFLVAECGLYAAPVLYRKRGFRREFLVVDGGLHHHLAAAGGLGQGIRRNYALDAFLGSDEDEGHTAKFTVAGCLCLPDDILASDVDLPSEIGEGDILVLFNSGAYAFTASPTRFLSHPDPREVVV